MSAPRPMPAAYVREVRLLRQRREISSFQMQVLLGLQVEVPAGKDFAGMSDEERAEAERIMREWRAGHPARAL